MYKLVILFEPPLNAQAFQIDWQKFMRLAENMPGLLSETVNEVESVPFDPQGHAPVKIHELCFADRAALEAALRSPAGQEAGRWLHDFTGGRFVLLIVRHMQANAKDFKQPSPSS